MHPNVPPVIEPRALAELLNTHPIRILDVRTPGEFESVHIRGAYNVPLDSLGEHAEEIRAVDEDIVLVCASGQRARKAETALATAGMSRLHVLDGGMTAWAKAGLPAIRGRERVSLERQVRIIAGSLTALGAVLAMAVHPWFAVIPAMIGAGLALAGITNSCAMAMMLAKLPYNRSQACDVGAMVRALTAGRGLE